MKLQTPPPAFQFRPAAGARTKKILRVIPVFEDTRAEDITDLPGVSTSAKKVIEAYIDPGYFKASAGKTLHLAQEGLLLGGLGKRDRFHPEIFAQLFRGLGKTIAGWKAKDSVQVILGKSLAEAIKIYNARSSSGSPFPGPSIDFKKKAGTRSSKAGEDRDDPDYAVPIEIEDLVRQMVACMSIGAESLEVLKSKSSEDQERSSTSKKKSVKKKATKTIVEVSAEGLTPTALKQAIQRGEAVAGAIAGARYIDALPGNFLEPAGYEAYARGLAKDHGLSIKVMGVDQLEKLGCGGILAVGRGSAIPPRMIVLEYRTSAKKKFDRPVVLVGKGITFDTGGISIKPSAEMHEMKYDMCGSALVLHALGLAAKTKLPYDVIGLLGIAENMPDGNAIKPGDVYTAYNGTTVEVQNTDAEGRLVLGDVLSYACDKYSPLCILDFATLTGACIIALGHDAAAVMTSSADLFSRIEEAAYRSQDRIWRLPHWSVYGTGLRSEVADLRNIAGRPAGTVSAMRFLSRFVEADIPWAHIDIAGAAWRSRAQGAQPGGPTGWGIRMMDRLFENLADGR